MIVEIQGVRAIKAAYPDVISIFVIPGNFSDLEERLQLRLPDKPDEVALRLANAKREIDEHRQECNWIVVNVKDELDATVREIVKIIEKY